VDMYHMRPHITELCPQKTPTRWPRRHWQCGQHPNQGQLPRCLSGSYHGAVDDDAHIPLKGAAFVTSPAISAQRRYMPFGAEGLLTVSRGLRPERFRRLPSSPRGGALDEHVEVVEHVEAMGAQCGNPWSYCQGLPPHMPASPHTGNRPSQQDAHAGFACKAPPSCVDLPVRTRRPKGAHARCDPPNVRTASAREHWPYHIGATWPTGTSQDGALEEDPRRSAIRSATDCSRTSSLSCCRCAMSVRIAMRSW